MPLIKINKSGNLSDHELTGGESLNKGGENSGAVRRFHDIARLVSDWIWETDADYRLSFISQRVMDTLGYHPLELKGRTLEDLGVFLTDDRKPFDPGYKKPFQNVLFSVEDNSGGTHYHHLSGVRVYDSKTGEFVGLRGTARDITEQLAAEESLRKSEERYRTLYGKSPVMAYSTGLDGNIVSVSDFWLQSLGYEESEVIGQPVARFIIRQDRDNGVPEQVDRGSIQPENSCRFINKGGEALDGLLYTATIDGPDGEAAEGLCVLMDVSESKRHEASLLRQANFDMLTGLPNRGLAMDRLGQAVVRARREDLMTAVMFVDVDNFKKINDILGHAAGDDLLIRVGEHLKECIRESDTVARLGGDEFLIILPDLKSVTHCENVAQKLIDRCARPFEIKGHEVVVTVSIGIGLFPNDGDDTDTLLRNADAAMYRSKAKGKNTFHFFAPEIDGHAHEHLMLESQLRKAMTRNELVMRYQPIVRADTGELTGMEALVRWQHPKLGRIPPAQFIPLAEDSGMIGAIGEWIMLKACREAVEMRDALRRDLTVAVNVSALQFTAMRPRLVDVVRETLSETGLPPDRLELEITESVIMSEIPENAVVLDALNGFGVRLAIDDFGTGYSSLSYLKRFPFDTLKIDRMFVRDIDDDPHDSALAVAIIAMAHALDLKVIGEGVETSKQLDFLRKRECDFIQGFHFSRPLDVDGFLQYARQDG